MTEEIKTQTPISKYAAKQVANRKTRVNEVLKTPAIKDADGTVATTTTFEQTQTKKFKKTKELPPYVANYPEHVIGISMLIKNNAEIRRFTALGILNYLLQKGEITGDKRYVSFKWNKFAVKSNGLMREYSYTEPFFINALVASFSSFSASAQKTIDLFCKKELYMNISKAVDQKEVENITSLNEQYTNANVESIVEE